MKTNIEKYLKENRLKLDTDQPDDDRIWKGINKQVIRKDKRPQSDWFWKIAAVFLLGVLTTYIVVKETTTEKVVVITLGDISKDLGQQEAELKMVVNRKWQEIEPLTATEKSQFKFILDELNELDNIYKTYENDLNTVGENEQIVNVLLDYYQKKIQLLNRLSMEIQKQKNHEKAI
jgi:hypothetical protein